MFFSENVIEDIRLGNDIVDVIRGYLPLEARGNDHFGLCPFHKEDTPSFSVSEDKQFYYCFGCGASGNVFGFVMQMENQSFPDAVTLLAERIHYQIPVSGKDNKRSAVREQMKEAHLLTAKYFHDILMGSAGKVARSYLINRGIKSDLASKFGLGLTDNNYFGLSDYLSASFEGDFLIESGLSVRTKKGRLMDRFRNRLMFPIFDRQGVVIAFGGRSLGDDMPKYLNSPDTALFNKSRVLYGLHFARQSKAKQIIVVEGYLDVIKLHQVGMAEVVATMGTAISLEHAKEIKKYFSHVTLLFDGDNAGEKAALRAIPHFLEVGIEPMVLTLPRGMDPDDYISNYGSVVFNDFVKEKAENYILYQVSLLGKDKNLDDFHDNITFQQEVAHVIGKLNSPAERHNYGKEVAKRYKLEENTIQSEISMINDQKEAGLFDIDKRPSIIRPRINTFMTERVDKSLDEARRLLIYYASQSMEYKNAIEANILPEDFQVEIYQTAYTAVIDMMDSKGMVMVANLLSLFETVESQQQITKIFAGLLPVEDKAMERDLVNNQIRLVLTRNLQRNIEKAAETADIQAMHLLQQELQETQMKVFL